MIRYLAIFLITSLIALVLWLPYGYAAADFYRTLRIDHSVCSDVWGESYADRALSSALSASEKKPSAAALADRDGSTPESKAAARLRGVISRVAAQPYFSAMEAMTTLAFYRLATMWYLTAGTTVFLIPALVDAAIRRTIRMHEIRQHDPERFAFALAGSITSFIALAAFSVYPAGISPLIFAVTLFAASYFIHVAVANYRCDPG